MGLWKVLFWIALTAEASAPENPSLAEARVFYLGADYAKCGERTSQARNRDNSQEQMAEIELYAGLCAFGLGRERSAAHHFALAKALQPEVALPPDASPKLVRLFESTETRGRATASEVHTEPPSPDIFSSPSPRPRVEGGTHVRVVHPLRPVTLVLGGMALVAGGTGAVLGLRAQSLADEARGARYEIDAFQQGGAAQGMATAANVAFGVAASVAVVAVLTHVLAKAEQP